MAWSKMGLCVINALVLMMTFIPRGGFAQLQLNPNPLRLTNGATSGSVQISCGIPSGVTNSGVYSLTISRYLKSAPTNLQNLAKASLLTNQGQAALETGSGLTQNTATVSGSITQKSMTLTLTQAKCEDVGSYGCVITYVGSTGDERIEGHENFTVIVPPGNITMTADPQIQVGNYLVGQPLTLSCNCMIGTYDSAEGETWRWSWQYQDYGGYNWTPYPNDKDITNEPPVKVTSSCQYHQISRLTVNLTIDDSQRTYRCVVQGTNNQGSSNAEYLLGVVAETDLTTLGTGANSCGCASSTKSIAPTQASSTESSVHSLRMPRFNIQSCSTVYLATP
ncbi:uncharacterized protein LOC112567955 [Pomacea canaliculata]|uniref:uncharacterized protein LOC112567955 n=1 Tax=Pomacea canaliculata TaxID=400727 RepID=UPI000D735E28|nr:uncharacterized protein LOC112567955 [Pomacea canaliculata]